jgi:hypothetical protein
MAGSSMLTQVLKAVLHRGITDGLVACGAQAVSFALNCLAPRSLSGMLLAPMAPAAMVARFYTAAGTEIV